MLAGGRAGDHPSWSWEPPVYPPSALIEMLPISFLPFQVARIVWYALTALSSCGALLILTRFFSPRYRPWAVLLAAYTIASEAFASGLYSGQLSGIAVSLAFIAYWFFFRGRSNLGVVCLGLSLGMKPQLAGLIFIVLLFDPQRRWLAIKSGIVAAALLAIGIGWLSLEPASTHWHENYHAQVESSLSPGAVNDPSAASAFAANFTNLQSASSLFIDSRVRNNQLAYALGGVLFLAWLYLAIKTAGIAQRREEVQAIALAAILCIGLLPVYHRHYDLVVLIFSFEALFLLLRKSRLGWPVLICTLFLLLPQQALSRWQSLAYGKYFSLNKLSFRLRLLLFQRDRSLVLVALAIVYLGALSLLVRRSYRQNPVSAVLPE